MNAIKILYKLEPGRASEFDKFENASLDAAKLLPHIESRGESIFALGDGLVDREGLAPSSMTQRVMASKQARLIL